jgi:hypothetical protein
METENRQPGGLLLPVCIYHSPKGENMKQIVQPLRSSQAQRQRQIALVLIVLGLAAAWGHLAGHSVGLSSHSASALTPISILALVAGLALAALTRQELKDCQTHHSLGAPQQTAMVNPSAVPGATRRLQLIHGSRTVDPQH